MLGLIDDQRGDVDVDADSPDTDDVPGWALEVALVMDAATDA
jgi:hypothetical protein